MPVSVVFDTNILISATLWPRGNPLRCLELAKTRVVESVTCEEILREFQEKLETKFNRSPAYARTAVDDVRSFSRVVAITGTVRGVSPDPDDDMVLECAVAGGADYIVSGDKRHLLALGSYQGIPIVTAARFLALVAQS